MLQRLIGAFACVALAFVMFTTTGCTEKTVKDDKSKTTNTTTKTDPVTGKEKTTTTEKTTQEKTTSTDPKGEAAKEKEKTK